MLRRTVPLLAVVLMVLPVVAHAQEGPPPEPAPADGMTPPPTPPPEPLPPPPPPPQVNPNAGKPYKYVPKPRERDLPPPDHRISITLSPLHLLTATGEVMGEFRVTDWFGAAVILGGGYPEASPGFRIPLFELGAQACFYPVGSFQHGLQLGAELLGVYATATIGTATTVNAGGVSGGLFIGYKIAARVGFTFVAQLGPNFTLVSAAGGGQSATQSGVGVLLNLNVGWSF